MQLRLFDTISIDDLAKSLNCSPFQIAEQFVLAKSKQFYRDNREQEKESAFTCPFCGSVHRRKDGELHSFKNYRGYELRQIGGRFLQAKHFYEVFEAYLCNKCSETRHKTIQHANIVASIVLALIAVITYCIVAFCFDWNNDFLPVLTTVLLIGLLGFLPFKFTKHLFLSLSKFAGAKSKLNLIDVDDALPLGYFDLAPMIDLSQGDNLSDLYNSTEAKKVLKIYGIERSTIVGESVVLDPKLLLEQKEYLLRKLANGLSQQDVNFLYNNRFQRLGSCGTAAGLS